MNKQYDRVLHVTDTFTEKPFDFNGVKYPYVCIVIAVAACHKLVSKSYELTTLHRVYWKISRFC